VISPLVYAGAAALANVAGALVVVRRSELGVRTLDLALAFGAGFMLAGATLGMLHEVFRVDGGAAPWLLAGFLAVHLAQHVLTPHFHFGEETHRVSTAAGISAAIGLSLHAFFDGVAISSGFLVSSELGVLLFLAVFFHKLPEGLSIASLALAAGQSGARAVTLSVVPAIATLLGGVLTTSGSSLLGRHGLALATGVTLYVAASNLIPVFQGRRGWPPAVAFFGGVAAFLVTEGLLGMLPGAS
jgi:ZIP family zinc transporter/zinc and cadmium transporter